MTVLSKIFERLVSVCHGRFMERSGVLPTTSLLIGKVWVPVMHFYAWPIFCQRHWNVCNPVHPLNGALPGPYVPVWVTRSAMVAHR